MHFEIIYQIGSHPFEYRCSSAFEALIATADINDSDVVLHLDMDDVMTRLTKLVAAALLSFAVI